MNRMLINPAKMSFSANANLLVPLQEKQDLPMEFQHGWALTEAEFKATQDKHDAFNQLCRQQLIEMNTNKINAIEDRGGDAGWE